MNLEAFLKVSNPSEEMCLNLIRNDYFVDLKSYNHIPEHFRNSEDFNIKVVKINPRQLKLIKNQTKSICLEAVRRNGASLELIKNADKEIIIEALKQSPLAIKYVKNLNFELCKIAVSSNGTSLKYIPTELKSYEICLIAVSQYGLALEYVPEEFKTPKLCLIAIKQDPGSLRFVTNPKNEHFLEAVTQNGLLLNGIPDEFKTLEICMEAVKNKCWALVNVPKHLQTPEMCLLSFKKPESKIYKFVKICYNPDPKTTISNLNKMLVNSTIKGIAV